MLDEYDIKVETGKAYNPSTKTDETTYALLFHTIGRLKSGSGLVARESDAGARTVVTVTRELHIPADSPAVPTGAVAFPTSLAASSDQTLIDSMLRLSGPAPGSQTTARRLEVSEVLT